jgi:CDGSH-type Zn-finger protein
MTDPIPAQKAPYKTSVEEGRSYYWCACGRSKNQPFCDGSHAKTDIRPLHYKAEASGDLWFCGCKHSGNKPLCDGTHAKL